MPRATETITQVVFIHADPADVYEAFIDPRKHSAFTGSKATCDPRVGGKFTAWDGYISGTNLKLEKGKRIVQEWKTTEWPKGCPPSTVDFSFNPKEGGTELTMVHSNVPAEQAEEYRQGWVDSYWDPMKEYFNKIHSTMKGGQ
jgi:activator of HSP90 ATPase